MKKLIALLLALTMVLSFAACANTGNPETTGSTEPKDDPAVKSEGVMTHAEYVAAGKNAQVTIEAYVQAKQGWWEQDGQGKATIYLQDTVGGYFAYNLHCTQEEYNKMTIGTKLRIKGYTTEYAGEYEIDGADATFEILEGNYVAPVLDATNLLANEDVIKYQNMKVSFKNATVVASTIKDDPNEYPFLYNYNGAGQAGSDLYFNVSINGKTYTFCVESYLCGDGTAVYEAVEALKIGDVIDMEGFLYWYNGVQPHITTVTPASK